MKNLGRLFAAFFIVGIPFSIWGGMNYTGFCWSKGRYLSNDELISGLINDLHINKKNYVSKKDIAKYVNLQIEEIYDHIPYKSTDDFLIKNPNCCIVLRSENQKSVDTDASSGLKNPPAEYRVIGKAWSTVSIRSKIFFLKANGKEEFFESTSDVWINQCGRYFSAPINYITGI